MKVGIILLSSNNMYVDAAGNLPKRPDFDKRLLYALAKGQKCVAGTNTRASLPASLRDSYEQVPWDSDYDLNLGIMPMVTNPPHLMIVVRSAATLIDGKSFSLDKYERYFSSNNLELWIAE